ncbi:hypothetical protein GCM10018793_48750 [Streptomyces sulfonofaciens]|uniref:Uncharacterized protein n=1 Tax=Streptomyces sulfonofaciens TaxID=68272 RepID=A0A919GI77_9ACTN|nr:hypothetical protein GCM10018793_48750 [Streptomyces sulfonofaciens]
MGMAELPVPPGAPVAAVAAVSLAAFAALVEVVSSVPEGSPVPRVSWVPPVVPASEESPVAPVSPVSRVSSVSPVWLVPPVPRAGPCAAAAASRDPLGRECDGPSAFQDEPSAWRGMGTSRDLGGEISALHIAGVTRYGRLSPKGACARRQPGRIRSA